MAFPTTLPADGTIHLEDYARFIVRNQRWEKFQSPNVSIGGKGSANNGFANVSWTLIPFNSGQHGPNWHIRVLASFVPKANVNIDMGFYSKSESKYLETANHYATGSSDGWVTWGDGGQNVHNWNKPTAFNTDGVWLANFDNSTRYSAANRPQTLDLTLVGVDSSNTLATWRFMQIVNGGGGVNVLNIARIPIKKPITDLTGMFLRCNGSNQFKSGRATVEVY